MKESFRCGADGIYRCEAFQQFVWQQHGFGTRIANPQAEVTLRQVHSDQVVNARGIADREREGDALITNEIGKNIGIRTADCVPILLLDARNRAVAAVHAGWRGSAAQIILRAIEQMHSDFNTDFGDLYAAIGPCIRDCCYEVGAEVAAYFKGSGAVTQAPAGKYHLNLPEANRRQMQAAGVDAGHIFDCGLCTTCESAQFFSYRRQPDDPGRMLSSICRLL